MRVIFGGSRHLKPSKQEMADLIGNSEFTILEVVCGGSGGVDFAAITYAKELGLPYTVFNAGWGKYGKAAGPIRNRSMAAYGDALLYYWDGHSAGTRNMIKEAKERGLKIYGINTGATAVSTDVQQEMEIG